MSIYTRTGDKGTTSLFGGRRVLKSDLRVETYGAIDELTTFIGLVITKTPTRKDKEFLISIQKDLYKIMGVLSGAKINLKFLANKVRDFEKEIDRLEKSFPKLTRFILPGGTETASWFQVLRAVCRRAERSAIRFYSGNLTMKPSHDLVKQFNNEIIKYLNRLSDLFFTLARFYNKGKEILT